MFNLSLNDVVNPTVTTRYGYSVGGMDLCSSVQFPQIALFSVPIGSQSAARSFTPESVVVDSLTLRYQGRAPFAGRLRLLEYYCNATHGLVRVDEQTAYWLDLDAQIALCGLDNAASDLALELLLGPVTVVFFNARNRYCLHAGCVATPLGAIALIAESGVGKSTLSASAGTAWQQISDDVLVVDALSLSISGAFPQLKLPAAMSDFYRALNQAATHQLAAIIRLVVTPAAQIALERMPPRDALLQVVRHSVGAKLLNGIELQRHTLFSAQLANAVPMWRLAYPRDRALLAEVRSAIIEAVRVAV